MAVVPTEAEVSAARALAARDVEIKRQEQEAEGKTFEHDAYGPGVIPEEIWQNIKADKTNE